MVFGVTDPENNPYSSGLDAEALRDAVARNRIQWHHHALRRMLERGITREQVKRTIRQGEIIEVYEQDRPYASCLILGFVPEPLHVVAALDPRSLVCHVITAYRPSLEQFEPDYRIRRKKS